MRAKFTAIDDRHVVAEYDCPMTGERQSRTFWCGSSRGAYVFESAEGGQTRQVCDGLGRRGSTLMMGSRPLIEVIRREYRAMVRAERAEAA